MERFDVAIVGAGPAGAAAALGARGEGASVVLLDRAAFPRDKACGDGIAAHVLDVLAGLGVHDAVDGYAPVPALRLVSPRGAVVARSTARPAHTVPRAVFDHRLVASAVRAGAVLRRHVVRSIAQTATGVTIDGVIHAATVVGADGAQSVVRRFLGHDRNPDGHVALAIRGYARAPRDLTEQRIVTTGTSWPAYAWAFPIGDGRANVGYGEVLAGRAVSRAHLLARLADLLPEIDTNGATGLRAHLLPLSTHRPAPGRGAIVLVGDALSLINPFTGEGIFYAVLSGSLAGRAAAHAALAGSASSTAARYTRALDQRLRRHLRHSTVAARLAQRPWIVDAAVRAADADRRTFDRVVELGLGDGLLDARSLIRIARHVRVP